MPEETVVGQFVDLLSLDLAAGTEEDLSKDGQSVDEIGDRSAPNKNH